MSDEQLLFRAVCEHPEEDTPRLVFADWLDEQGGEANADRAAYIRPAIELENHGGEHRAREDATTAKLRKREQVLLKKYRRRWEAPLVGKGGVLYGEHLFTNFDRGFISRTGASAGVIVERG